MLEKHLDVRGETSEKVLHYGYLNSYHHTGLKNLLDEAILDHEELEERLKAKEKYHKIDEIPFDFVRRRMSVVIEDETGLNTLICKGAMDEVMSQCSRVEINGEVVGKSPEYDAISRQMVSKLNAEGFRVIAIGYKQMPGATDEPKYSVKDESDLILQGFLAFLDPPKDTAAEALRRLHGLNVDVKILTGDNEIITAYICKQVGMPVENLLLGSQIEAMDEAQLAKAVSKTRVFARLVSAHIHSKSGKLAANRLFADHSRGRRVANGFALGRHAGICPAATPVLAATGNHVGMLCDSDPGREDLVHR